MEKISKFSSAKNALKGLALVAFLSSGAVAKAVETPLSDPIKSTKLSKHVPKNEKGKALYKSINEYLRAESGVAEKPERYRELGGFVQKRFANKKGLQADEKGSFTVSLHDVVAFLDTFTIYYDENNDYLGFSVTSIEGDYAFCDKTFTSNTTIGTKAEKKMNTVTPTVQISNESKRHDSISSISESVSASGSEYIYKNKKFSTIAGIENALHDMSGREIIFVMAAYYCAPCEAAYDHHQNKPLIDSKMIKVNVSNKDDLNYFLGQTGVSYQVADGVPYGFVYKKGKLTKILSNATEINEHTDALYEQKYTDLKIR